MIQLKELKNYTPYIFSFLFIPIIICFLLLLPYISSYGFIYYSVKPFGMQIFGTKEAMWGFIGVLSAAIGILIGFIFQNQQRKERAKNLVNSLYEEILNNIELLFTGEVERPYYYEAFENIKRDYSDIIQNNKAFRDIRILYDELRYYQEIIKFFRYTNYGDIVTERQLGACLKYIKYFETSFSVQNTYIHNPIDDNNQAKRDRAIKVKNDNLIKWEKTLRKNLEKIFKL